MKDTEARIREIVAEIAAITEFAEGSIASSSKKYKVKDGTTRRASPQYRFKSKGARGKQVCKYVPPHAVARVKKLIADGRRYRASSRSSASAPMPSASRRNASRRTSSATASPRTCSSTARTSAPSRRCSAMRTSARRRSTRTSTRAASPRSTASIRATERNVYLPARHAPAAGAAKSQPSNTVAVASSAKKGGRSSDSPAIRLIVTFSNRMPSACRSPA